MRDLVDVWTYLINFSITGFTSAERHKKNASNPSHTKNHHQINIYLINIISDELNLGKKKLAWFIIIYYTRRLVNVKRAAFLLYTVNGCLSSRAISIIVVFGDIDSQHLNWSSFPILTSILSYSRWRTFWISISNGLVIFL